MRTALPILAADQALVFRISHRDNVEWTLRHGLHCRNSALQNSRYVRIGNAHIIETRRAHPVPCAPGGTLSDYIPFYFTPLSVMLLNILIGRRGVARWKPKDLVFFVTSFAKLRSEGVPFIFTDRYAWSAQARFFPSGADLGVLPWDDLRSRDMSRNPKDPSKIDRYQAETLVHRALPIHALLGLACFDPATAADVERMAEGAGLNIKVEVRREWYFR